jgi:hypothetical protein
MYSSTRQGSNLAPLEKAKFCQFLAGLPKKAEYRELAFEVRKRYK